MRGAWVVGRDLVSNLRRSPGLPGPDPPSGCFVLRHSCSFSTPLANGGVSFLFSDSWPLGSGGPLQWVLVSWEPGQHKAK